MEAPTKVLAFENGLFCNVAIVRADDGGLKFCPSSKFEDTDSWTIHDGYSSDHLDDIGFEDVTEAIGHAKKIGWTVVVVQE